MKAANRRRSRLYILLSVVIGGGACFVAHQTLAMYMRGDDAPVDRLVSNITAYLQKKPKNAAALYLLGRVNALAYASKSYLLYAYDFNKQQKGELPHLDEHYNGYVRDDEPHIPAEDAKKLLIDAVTNYRAAVKVAPNIALYHLSLASTVESGVKDLCETDLIPELNTVLKEDKRKESYGDIMSKGYLTGATDAALLKKLKRAAIDFLPQKLKTEEEQALEKQHTKDLQNIAKSAAEALEQMWLEDAIEHYWRAYMLAVHTDIKERESHSMADDTPIAQEAAQHYLALVRKRGPTELEALRIPQIEADVKTIKGRGFGAVTPIIFSETENLPLQDLLTPQRVHFDMDGDGLIDECSWVKPETSILVWDPKRAGVVTSGRQLFGSVTWWIFWSDGYQALAALDDNGDGELSGAELRGLAVWRDRNGDGISDPGEVVPIEETEIAEIAVFSTETVSPNASLANRGGLKMKDGRRLPTYDWVVKIEIKYELRVPPAP